MRLHLPPHLQTVCDLNTLKLESGSFVEESLRPYFSDVLYSLQSTTGDAYIHVLIEHQSTPDKHMASGLSATRWRRCSAISMPGIKSCRWLSRCCSIPAAQPLPLLHCWLDEFDDPALAEKALRR